MNSRISKFCVNCQHPTKTRVKTTHIYGGPTSRFKRFQELYYIRDVCAGCQTELIRDIDGLAICHTVNANFKKYMRA